VFSTPIANLLLRGRILSTTGNFTGSIKGKSSIFSRNRWYGLWPLMIALTLDLSTRLWGINPTNSVVIPRASY